MIVVNKFFLKTTMNSLHYLKDYDLIELLGDYVLKAYLRKKDTDLEEARQFHEKNFQDYVDENEVNHYLISDVITDLRQNYPFIYPRSCSNWIPFLDITDPSDNLKLYNEFSWTPLNVSDRVKIYNDSVESYKENTKLQRCGYQY